MTEKALFLNYLVVGSNETVFKTPCHLVSTDQEHLRCPSCSELLDKYYSLIPISKEKRAKVPGMWCRKCDVLYVKDAGDLKAWMLDNPFSKGFTFDGHTMWNFTAEQRRVNQERLKQERKEQYYRARLNKLSNFSSSEMMICIRRDDRTYSDYIIVSNNKEADNIERFHYSSAVGRELLSAAYAKERNSRGSLQGINFSVITRVYPKGKDRREFSDHFILTQLLIKSGGGYLNSSKNKNYEIVDMMVYSLKTDRYEIMRATYDDYNDECFVDIGLYRNYVSKFGHPNISPDFGYHPASGGKSFDELNGESILMGYGYSVGKKERLGKTERQALLAEIVDLEILTVKRVVSLLDFFIQTHSNEMYFEARTKWEADKKYIQEYRVNPQRFLIAG